ncbi:MAG: hypothetical protein WBW85_14330 [Terriglobales bacterium]
MTSERHPPGDAGHDPPESLSPAQEAVLRSALAKLVEFGSRVGVTPDQMIRLLKAGMTIVELLEYLADRAGEDP